MGVAPSGMAFFRRRSRQGCLGVELGDVNTRLETERSHLACEWRQLEVFVNYGRLQCDHARAEAEESLAAAREARDRTLEEA